MPSYRNIRGGETQCQKAGTAGAAFGIVRGQELIWTHGYGYSDLNAEGAPDDNTLFRIASITKTFTALAIFQLRDEGLLSLDDALTFASVMAAVVA